MITSGDEITRPTLEQFLIYFSKKDEYPETLALVREIFRRCGKYFQRPLSHFFEKMLFDPLEAYEESIRKYKESKGKKKIPVPFTIKDDFVSILVELNAISPESLFFVYPMIEQAMKSEIETNRIAFVNLVSAMILYPGCPVNATNIAQYPLFMFWIGRLNDVSETIRTTLISTITTLCFRDQSWLKRFEEPLCARVEDQIPDVRLTAIQSMLSLCLQSPTCIQPSSYAMCLSRLMDKKDRNREETFFWVTFVFLRWWNAGKLDLFYPSPAEENTKTEALQSTSNQEALSPLLQEFYSVIASSPADFASLLEARKVFYSTPSKLLSHAFLPTSRSMVIMMLEDVIISQYLPSNKRAMNLLRFFSLLNTSKEQDIFGRFLKMRSRIINCFEKYLRSKMEEMSQANTEEASQEAASNNRAKSKQADSAKTGIRRLSDAHLADLLAWFSDDPVNRLTIAVLNSLLTYDICREWQLLINMSLHPSCSHFELRNRMSKLILRLVELLRSSHISAPIASSSSSSASETREAIVSEWSVVNIVRNSMFLLCNSDSANALLMITAGFGQWKQLNDRKVKSHLIPFLRYKNESDVQQETKRMKKDKKQFRVLIDILENSIGLCEFISSCIMMPDFSKQNEGEIEDNFSDEKVKSKNKRRNKKGDEDEETSNFEKVNDGTTNYYHLDIPQFVIGGNEEKSRRAKKLMLNGLNLIELLCESFPTLFSLNVLPVDNASNKTEDKTEIKEIDEDKELVDADDIPAKKRKTKRSKSSKTVSANKDIMVIEDEMIDEGENVKTDDQLEHCDIFTESKQCLNQLSDASFLASLSVLNSVTTTTTTTTEGSKSIVDFDISSVPEKTSVIAIEDEDSKSKKQKGRKSASQSNKAVGKKPSKETKKLPSSPQRTHLMQADQQHHEYHLSQVSYVSEKYPLLIPLEMAAPESFSSPFGKQFYDYVAQHPSDGWSLPLIQLRQSLCASNSSVASLNPPQLVQRNSGKVVSFTALTDNEPFDVARHFQSLLCFALFLGVDSSTNQSLDDDDDESEKELDDSTKSSLNDDEIRPINILDLNIKAKALQCILHLGVETLGKPLCAILVPLILHNVFVEAFALPDSDDMNGSNEMEEDDDKQDKSVFRFSSMRSDSGKYSFSYSSEQDKEMMEKLRYIKQLAKNGFNALLNILPEPLGEELFQAIIDSLIKNVQDHSCFFCGDYAEGNDENKENDEDDSSGQLHQFVPTLSSRRSTLSHSSFNAFNAVSFHRDHLYPLIFSLTFLRQAAMQAPERVSINNIEKIAHVVIEKVFVQTDWESEIDPQLIIALKQSSDAKNASAETTKQSLEAKASKQNRRSTKKMDLFDEEPMQTTQTTPFKPLNAEDSDHMDVEGEEKKSFDKENLDGTKFDSENELSPILTITEMHKLDSVEKSKIFDVASSLVIASEWDSPSIQCLLISLALKVIAAPFTSTQDCIQTRQAMLRSARSSSPSKPTRTTPSYRTSQIAAEISQNVQSKASPSSSSAKQLSALITPKVAGSGMEEIQITSPKVKEIQEGKVLFFARALFSNLLQLVLQHPEFPAHIITPDLRSAAKVLFRARQSNTFTMASSASEESAPHICTITRMRIAQTAAIIIFRLLRNSPVCAIPFHDYLSATQWESLVLAVSTNPSQFVRSRLLQFVSRRLIEENLMLHYFLPIVVLQCEDESNPSIATQAKRDFHLIVSRKHALYNLSSTLDKLSQLASVPAPSYTFLRLPEYSFSYLIHVLSHHPLYLPVMISASSSLSSFSSVTSDNDMNAKDAEEQKAETPLDSAKNYISRTLRLFIDTVVSTNPSALQKLTDIAELCLISSDAIPPSLDQMPAFTNSPSILATPSTSRATSHRHLRFVSTLAIAMLQAKREEMKGKIVAAKLYFFDSVDFEKCVAVSQGPKSDKI
ncbi:uncharacterized protein MONOS_12088 [Monocercomonoides exilis]|uniref:uncharacterized protein n=1 Tax=Monocercomonoides exilis TaxID=2049356 RepID=UPI00355A4113|nr:hypothetical protein MONOS_12088 [Monocercomonoides exilis]|eukprot:MONOS_12088.1-p1 / transcript=MONOS_12088.1 / gene=MONOS_12088 / organism=Monocercomonoides_exilis_PA203 / gene_product=unspecified product / transcript_product=unspecified product / location=Mono_scaffold00644:16744-23694(-) / protein_length=1910 / sequence_SO=supercontig / SO=protein_coding / is_pseudo=false